MRVRLMFVVFTVLCEITETNTGPVSKAIADWIDNVRSGHPVLVIFNHWEELHNGLLEELHSRFKSIVLWKVSSTKSLKMPALFHIYFFRAVVSMCDFSCTMDSISAVQEDDGYFHNRTWLIVQPPDNSQHTIHRLSRSKYPERILLMSRSEMWAIEADHHSIHRTTPDEWTNLRDKELTVSTLNYHPTIALKLDENGRIRGYGLVFDILNMASERLNFSYRVMLAQDGLYGNPTRNGSWTGIVGNLMSGEADLTGTLLQVTPDRSNVIDFSVGLFVDEMRIMQKMPSEEQNKDALLAPFTSQVWAAITTSLVLAAFLIYLIVAFGEKLHCNKNANGINSQGRPTMSAIFWHLYATILNQGDKCVTSAAASRIALATYGIFAFLITSYYTALLTAFMFAPLYDIKIRSIQDFEKYTEVPFVVKNGSAFYSEIWKESTDNFKVLREGLLSGRGVTITNDGDAIRMIRDSGFVYIQRELVVENLIRNDLKSTGKCGFYSGVATFYDTPVGLAYRKNSPYREVFDEQLSLMRSHGHLSRLMSTYYAPAGICSLPHYSDIRALTVSDHTTTWKILGIGILAALLCHCSQMVFVALRGRHHHRRIPRQSRHYYWFIA